MHHVALEQSHADRAVEHPIGQMDLGCCEIEGRVGQDYVGPEGLSVRHTFYHIDAEVGEREMLHPCRSGFRVETEFLATDVGKISIVPE